MYPLSKRKSISPFFFLRLTITIRAILTREFDSCIIKKQARIETEKYKKETEETVVTIPFHSNRLMDYNRKK